MAWSADHTEILGGLTPGDTVGLLHGDGSLSSARLGTLSCLKGECRGDYAGVTIDSGRLLDDVTVLTTRHDAGPAIPLLPVSTPDACPGLPPPEGDPNGFGFPSIGTTCTTYSPGGGNEDLAVRLGAHGWMQENGWPVYLFFVEDTRAGASDHWTILSSGTAPLEPRFAWIHEDGAVDLLWIRQVGIIGPQAYTLREQSIDADGNAAWVSTYQAGGQPCD